MKRTTVFFDLDGTLLPMDQDTFVKSYFQGLAQKLSPLGYEPKQLFASIWDGTRAMVMNDGSRTNEEAFWDCFCRIYGEKARLDEPVFDAFYHTDFQKVAGSCGFTPKAAETVALCKTLGLRTVLATNPIFPAIATQSRIRWAGLKPEDFELYTTYENSRFCKPNPAYYQSLLTALDLQPQECLMVGNDVGEDMIARKLGMEVFLLTDCLINKSGGDVSDYPHGSFEELMQWLRQMAE